MRDWARHAHGSPLYARLSHVVADSSELMRVVNRIENTPRPNVLFAAVQYLLLGGVASDLAAFYGSLVAEPEPPEDVGDPFHDFVLAHEKTIVELGRTRYTQTNECRRCVGLLPAIWRTGIGEFHLVDVGTSAGLNLLIDLYRYRWDGVEWGPVDSPLTLTTELRGEAPEPADIEVLSRTGLDLNPIDPSDHDGRLWLEALVWPEHEERRQRLSVALRMAMSVDMKMVAGSALNTLGPVLADLPGTEPAVVMNSFALNQFSQEQRAEVDAIVEAARENRPVARVFFEHLKREDSWQTIGLDVGSGPNAIGHGHSHGEWVELYARP